MVCEQGLWGGCHLGWVTMCVFKGVCLVSVFGILEFCACGLMRGWTLDAVGSVLSCVSVVCELRVGTSIGVTTCSVLRGVWPWEVLNLTCGLLDGWFCCLENTRT